ncbi:MAG: chemotaxis response regulator protein-glutamate methylesterase [Lachnospiraceae bacterium]
MKKNILVVDDSALMRRVLCDIINTEQRLQAIDVCRDGLEAYEKLKTTRYDAVLLDINMPRMDGLELLDQLNKDHIQATVIMVSTLTKKDASVTILAMEKGAVDFITKPSNIIEAKGEDFKRQLLEILEAVLFKQTVRTRTEGKKLRIIGAPKKAKHQMSSGGSKIVALACSTGGPKALQSVIPYLPANLDAPVVLVQHMPVGFTKSMADRLNQISKINVKEAQDGEILQKGWVYVAPGGKHMEIQKTAGGHRVALNDRPAIGGLRPCADVMYDSLKSSTYDSVTCVVLTGMGADATKGILSLRQSKPIHVIAQNEESCVVYGMPKSIVETGVVNEVVPLTEVAQSITKNVGVE